MNPFCLLFGRRCSASNADSGIPVLTALATIALMLALAACGESATLSVAAGTGPHPTLPEPVRTLIPTVNIAPAKGWDAGATPQAAPGTQVAAFADKLDHPRWLYVLPNGDVLVAETNAPPKPEGRQGISGWVMGRVMQRAGAAAPSANRITLLRDTDGDGRADFRSVLLAGLHSPFGMALVGQQLYIANTDAVVRFPYQTGDTEIRAAGTLVVALPGGPVNHHWTKNLIASKDGQKLYPIFNTPKKTSLKINNLQRTRFQSVIFSRQTTSFLLPPGAALMPSAR